MNSPASSTIFNNELPVLTREALSDIALENGGYETPHLNDSLYLHYKGYTKIENLEDYTGLKALWLDSNGFQKIENLSHLKILRCLFLQRNLISKIENLDVLTNLVQLDLSENRIERIENLSLLKNLSTLNISKNLLKNGNSIKHIQLCHSLSSIDFSNNQIRGEDVMDIFSASSSLVSLNMNGNPIVSELQNFRKRCIICIKKLRFLDTPIFDNERDSTEAWGIGGREAELRVKKEWQKKKQDENKNSLQVSFKYTMSLFTNPIIAA